MRSLLVFSTVTFSAMLLLIFGLAAASYPRLAVTLADEPANKNEVKIDNFNFAPATLTVPAGTRITWVNRDDVPHNVISTDKKFASPVLDTDEQFSYEFKDPGTYLYYCSIHPKMTGKVVVQ
jgi:Icc protein